MSCRLSSIRRISLAAAGSAVVAADLDVADLKPLLGPHNAKLLHAFFRRPNDLFKPTPATGRGYDPRLNREPAS